MRSLFTFEKALAEPEGWWQGLEGCAGVSPLHDCYSITGLKLTRGLFHCELSTAPRDANTWLVGEITWSLLGMITLTGWIFKWPVGCGCVGWWGLRAYTGPSSPGQPPPHQHTRLTPQTKQTCRVTRHTSHVTLSDGVRGFFAISAGDNSKRKLGNGREYAGEFTALEWPLVFVAFEKGLVYWCCAAASHGWAITAFSYLYAGSEWIDLTWKLQLQTGEWSEDRRETEYIGRPSQAETLPCLSIYRLDHLVRATGQGRPHTVTTNCNSRTITPSHHHQLKVISAISDGAIELSRTFPAPSTLNQTQASPR